MEKSFDLLITASHRGDGFRVYAESATQGQAEGTLALGPDRETLAQLQERPVEAAELEAQGAALYRALFAGSVGILFNQALGEVLAEAQAVLRLRLRIDPPELAILPWELLFDPERGRFLATWSKTLLSRSFALLEPVRPLAAPGVLRLLVVVPRSSGLATEDERATLAGLPAGTAGRIEVRQLAAPVTLEAIRAALREEDFHLLHYAGHGVLRDDGAELFLDHPDHAGAQAVPSAAFARLLQDHASLRLVVLNACQGAARSTTESLAGLSSQLLRHGVPAVVAMQSSLPNRRALRFAAELYGELAMGRWAGQVERAVALARSALLQERAHDPDFANPVLYLRAPDGRLWQPAAELPHAPGSAAPALRAARLPLPPASFFGRADDLRFLKTGLCRATGAGAERGPLLLLTGWPGVGKTTMTTKLANDSELLKAFPNGILWTALDQEPSLLTELRSWCIALGSPGPSPTDSIAEASLLLARLLRQRRVLLLLDDIWETAHAVPFLVGGPGCAMLATSRLDAVAEQLAPSSGAIYRLPLLSEEAGLELLRSRAPQVVAEHPEPCRILVRELEGLPLSLHVAGRMLAEESRLWSPDELLETLRAGRELLAQEAPHDRTDLRRETLPTLSVLLAKSTERLPPELRERFAFLGVLAPKPATFDLAAMRALWDVDDPKPTVRSLVNLGLLEPTGDGRFHMHSLLVAHAESLLDEV